MPGVESDTEHGTLKESERLCKSCIEISTFYFPHKYNGVYLLFWWFKRDFECKTFLWYMMHVNHILEYSHITCIFIHITMHFTPISIILYYPG